MVFSTKWWKQIVSYLIVYHLIPSPNPMPWSVLWSCNEIERVMEAVNSLGYEISCMGAMRVDLADAFCSQVYHPFTTVEGLMLFQ
ncbi:hypothetical protein Peur_069604 [Populus x canadensis]